MCILLTSHLVGSESNYLTSYLQVLLKLDFVLSREHFVFFLEFCKQQLFLELLLLFEQHEFLLELLLSQGRVDCSCTPRQRAHPGLCPQVHWASSSTSWAFSWTSAWKEQDVSFTNPDDIFDCVVSLLTLITVYCVF